MKTLQIRKSHRSTRLRSKNMVALAQAIESLEDRVLLSTIAGWSAQSLALVTASPWAATTTDPSLSTTPGLNRDTGLTQQSLTRGFASSGFPTAGPVNGGASTTDLFFDLTVKGGFTDSLSEFDLNYRSTGTGPTNAELDYSVNGGTSFTAINTAIGGAGFTTTSTFQSIAPVSLTGISALQNIAAGTTVRFRLVPYGGTATTGTFAVFNNTNANNDLAILGTTSNVPVAPSITSLSPNTGSTAGGNTVTINGSAFTGATDVNFAGTDFPSGSFTVVSDSKITLTAPAHAAGTFDVTVTNAIGTSTTSASDHYTFTTAPIFASLSPSAGPLAGGITVTINGTNFTGATSVSFGGTPGTSLVVVNDSQVTVTAPAHAVGSVDVTVTTPNGTSATSAADTFTYDAAPTVTSFTPTSGVDSGGNSVVITGTGFVSGATVTFGGVAATTVTVNSATQITAITPAHAVGAVNVVVSDAGGSVTAGTQFTYGLTTVLSTESLPKDTTVTIDTNPVITQVLELAGATVTEGAFSHTYTNTAFLIEDQDGTGATEIFLPTTISYTPVVGNTISVTGQVEPFDGAPEIGGTGATNITAISTTGTATVPNPLTETIPVANVNPLPTTLGGFIVTIKGVDITGISGTFGTTSLTGTITDSSGLTGHTMTFFYSITSDGAALANLGNTTIPTSNLVDVTGFLNEFVSGATTTPQFNVISLVNPSTVPPSVTSVNPIAGPTAGGNLVTINGFGFTGTTSVKFGTVAGTGLTVVNDNQITVTAPAEAAGTVDVTVTNPNGTSAISAADNYQFTVAPVVSSISPQGGPVAGGTTVTITGSNFVNGATVKFGGTAATGVVVNSPTSITCVSPAEAAGTVDVTVTESSVTSATSANDKYTYASAPTVTNITPNSGLDSGGTSVTITGTGFITGGTTVTIGGVAATSVVVTSSTTLTAVTAAHAAGVVDVVVTDVAGTGTDAGAFTYLQTTLAVVEGLTSGTVVTVTSNPVITQILSSPPGPVNGLPYTNWSFLIQDGTASMDVFGVLPAGFTPVVGNTISVTGKFAPFDSVPEIGTVTAISNIGTAAVPGPLSETISGINAATLSNSIGGFLVSLNGVNISNPPAGATTFGTTQLSMTITDSSGTMTMFYDPKNYSSANQNFFGISIPGSTTPVDLKGIVQIFSGAAEFVPMSTPDVFNTFTMSTGLGAEGNPDGFSSVARGTPITVTVTRTDGSAAGSVNYTVVPDSAVAGTDYTVSGGVSGILNFPASPSAGSTSQTFTINIPANPGDHGDKLFTIQLSNPTGGAGFIATVSGGPATVVIKDPAASNTVSNSAFNENQTIQPAGPRAAPGGFTAFNVESNQASNGANTSYGVLTYDDSFNDPSDVFTAIGSNQIYGIELETVAAPASFDVSGPLNVYVVTSNPAGNPGTTYGTGLTFDTAGNPVEGVGNQLGTKYLLGQIQYSASQVAGVYTPYNLTNLDSTGLALLTSDLNSTTPFSIVVTPGNSTVTATWLGTNATGADRSPILRFNFGPTVVVTAPTWIDPANIAGTNYTWNSTSHSLNVLTSVHIIADPGNDEPIITTNSGASITVDVPDSSSQVQPIHIGGLTLTGATMTIDSVGSRTATHHDVMVIPSGGAFSIDGTSKLNLMDNDAILSAGSLSAVTTSIKNGIGAAGLWNGTNGLTSSSAAASPSYKALGVEKNDNPSSPGTALTSSFDNQTVVDGDILVKYTYVGDTQLAGKFNSTVSASDYAAIDNGFNMSLSGWTNGDFNYDGKINGDDYSLIDNAFNNSLTQTATPLSQVAATPAKPLSVFSTGAAIAVSIPGASVIGTASGGDGLFSDDKKSLADEVFDN